MTLVEALPEPGGTRPIGPEPWDRRAGRFQDGAAAFPVRGPAGSRGSWVRRALQPRRPVTALAKQICWAMIVLPVPSYLTTSFFQQAVRDRE